MLHCHYVVMRCRMTIRSWSLISFRVRDGSGVFLFSCFVMLLLTLIQSLNSSFEAMLGTPVLCRFSVYSASESAALLKTWSHSGLSLLLKMSTEVHKNSLPLPTPTPGMFYTEWKRNIRRGKYRLCNALRGFDILSRGGLFVFDTLA